MSKYAYLRLCTNGEIKIIDAKETFSLQELQAEVGGGIEIVNCRYGENLCMVVNDEGLLENLPVNPYGTILYRGLLGNAWIVGDAVLCIRRMDPEPDVYPMFRSNAELIKEMLKSGLIHKLDGITWR